MAQMIPDSISSKASQGEQTLFSILRDRLPDDFTVWFEPEVKGYYPDFVILGPGFGLLILEVKGWNAGQISEANKNFFQITYKKGSMERTESQRSPLRQAHDYFVTVTEKLIGYPILRQPDGNYQGKLVFPIGTGAVMANMTEAQARHHNLHTLLEKPQVAYRDELLEWMNFSDRELIQRLKDMFKVYFPFFVLTDDQVSTIKGVIHPEMAVREVPATEESVPQEVKLPPDSTVIISLDIEQEKLARSLKEGHRLFCGVAGSGKTLILLARAKALANRLTQQRILILTFNITLAAYLRSLLHNDHQNPQYRERIEVRHFHDWARSLLGRLPNPREFHNSEECDEFLGMQVSASLTNCANAEKWDSVLVDEAHTFSPQWLRCCVDALRDPQNGDLMIVSDVSQSLYKRHKLFSWSSVGIKAQGRTKILSQNYRNTQEILTAAWKMLQSPAEEELTSEYSAFPTVVPSAAIRHGSKPVLHLTQSHSHSIAAVVEQVKRLSDAGYALGDISIIYRWLLKKDEALFQEMRRQIDDLGLSSYWVTENAETKSNYNSNVPGVRIITALSSLGLEFKAVLIWGVEQFADSCGNDAEKATLARRQLYVAMTRAQDELHLFSGGQTSITDELERSQNVEIVRKGFKEPYSPTISNISDIPF